MKIKIPIKDLQKEDTCSKVEETLIEDMENAYTVAGIMVEKFGVKREDINNKPFSAWKKDLPALYGRIDRCLKRLAKQGKANMRKHGKAWVYWYAKPQFKSIVSRE